MFSLKSLLLSVLVAGVFVVAILNSSPIWAGVIITLTVLLLGGVLIAIYLVPTKRPFLICAVIMGALYLGLALCRPLGVSRMLLTTQLMFEWWVTESGYDISKRELAYDLWMNDRYMPSSGSTPFDAFQTIGHCAVALILAVIAGLVGSYVARRRDVNTRASHVQP